MLALSKIQTSEESEPSQKVTFNLNHQMQHSKHSNTCILTCRSIGFCLLTGLATLVLPGLYCQSKSYCCNLDLSDRVPVLTRLSGGTNLTNRLCGKQCI